MQIEVYILMGFGLGILMNEPRQIALFLGFIGLDIYW